MLLAIPQNLQKILIFWIVRLDFTKTRNYVLSSIDFHDSTSAKSRQQYFILPRITKTILANDEFEATIA